MGLFCNTAFAAFLQRMSLHGIVVLKEAPPTKLNIGTNPQRISFVCKLSCRNMTIQIVPLQFLTYIIDTADLVIINCNVIVGNIAVYLVFSVLCL